mmetsp:Transcript_73470/g.175097  ORF Transcript_73470/g.175097 Transcript_73470/m.175097 type:complete len:91 (-) Transcript_73470:2302-2574(-)
MLMAQHERKHTAEPRKVQKSLELPATDVSGHSVDVSSDPLESSCASKPTFRSLIATAMEVPADALSNNGIKGIEEYTPLSSESWRFSGDS